MDSSVKTDNDHFTVAALRRFNAKIKIARAFHYAHHSQLRENARARFKLILPADWWREEAKVCGYFGFDDAEIDCASESFENYLGTKNGFDCYVRPRPHESDIMDSETLYEFVAEVSKLEYPKVKIDGKEYYAVDLP